MAPPQWQIEEGDPCEPGAHAHGGGVSFGVVSSNADTVFVELFDDGGRETRLALPGTRGDLRYGFVPGAKAGLRYGLRAEGPWDPARGHRFDATKLLVDPYASQIDRPFAWHADLATRGLDTSGLVPRAIVPASPRAEPAVEASVEAPPSLIYELQVKAFTKRHREVPERLRGTVAALAEPCIVAHFERIGVEAVELMPLAAWIDERHLPPLGLANAWGYNPVTFMAPDPRLAPGGLAEVRKAVDALHGAGIGVILDVVFNHTGESDAFGPTLSLRGLDNALYYRHAEDGTLINDTGTGNTLALDRAATVKLALDALRHWIATTGIDGFRFDLAPVMGRTDHGFVPDAPLLAAIESDDVLRTRVMIAEPWDVGPGGYQLGRFPPRWLEWNDSYRDRVRRFWRGDAGAVGEFATAIAGSSDFFGGRRPSCSVNFVAAHDGFTLRDAVTFREKRNHANGEDNRDGNAHEVSWEGGGNADIRALLATLLFSRGTAMLTAGDEFGRTQSGNNNAYAQDNETTWLDWDRADDSLIDFVAEMVKLRGAIAEGRSDTFLTGADAEWLGVSGAPMDWSREGQNVIALVLRGARRVGLWFNRGQTEAAVTLPELPDFLTWSPAKPSMCRMTGDCAAVLPPRSVAVLLEERSKHRRTSRAPDDATIAALADAAGIQPEWWEIDGRHHRVSIDTRRALLAAMRLEIATSRTARDETTRLRAVAAAPVAFGAHVAYLPDELAHGGRSFGLTTHLYALRDRRDHGIGDFTTLRRFGETAKSFGGTFAGINPLHHLFPTDRERASPYQPSDRRFVDPIYIDLEPLLSVPSTRAALNADEAEQLRRRHHVDYGGVWRLKRRVLEAAFTAFEADRHDALFESFVLRGGDALRLHGAFETLAAHFGTVDRGRWSPPLRDPRSSAVAAFAREHERDIRFRAYLQWLADRQLADAAKAAPGLGLYGDLALGVARDSGEVWAAPELFAPGVSIGAPPDPFAADGQNWNLPPFIPHALRAAGFAPLADILGNNMRHFGILRIDHVLGFARQFWIPDGASGPDGAYVTFPLDDLLAITARQSRAANCIVIGEDLGTVPEGLRARLQTANVLSYRMLWFERDGIRFRPPTDYPALSAACLSSHDLVPFLGWAANAPPEERRALIDAIERQGLEAGESAADLMAAAHALVAKSPSALLLVQADDLAGETKPLNVPGTDRERPNWRHRFAGAIEDLPASPLARRVIAAVRKERP